MEKGKPATTTMSGGGKLPQSQVNVKASTTDLNVSDYDDFPDSDELAQKYGFDSPQKKEYVNNMIKDEPISFITQSFFMCWKSLQLGYAQQCTQYYNSLRGFSHFHHGLATDGMINLFVIMFIDSNTEFLYVYMYVCIVHIVVIVLLLHVFISYFSYFSCF